jgi:hypothetical protein
MPLDQSHDLTRAQFLQEDATGKVFRACNCSSVPANRTLRFAAKNRELFSVWPPKAQAPSTPAVPDTPKSD